MTRKKYCFEKQALFFFFLIVCHLGSAVIARAQNESEKGLPFITNYLPKNYKALPQTWSIMEDDRGLMYFGVQNGILEYDGVKWRKVFFKNIPAIVRTLAKDKNGKIYYGAIGDFGYLGKDSIGQTIGISLIDKIPTSSRNFFDIWTIHVADEGIYFQSREMILRLKGDKELKTWKPKANFMYAFYLDHDYYVHEQGLGLFKMVNDSLELIPGSEFLGKERMQVMLPYSLASNDNKANEKQYLLGLFYSGLYLFNGKTFSPFYSEATPFLKAGTLYKGSKSTDGKYVLSTTGKGLVIIDENGKIIQQINRDVGLQDESVYVVFFDSKGSLWLGLDNGISRVETTSPLTQFTNQAGINTSALSLARFEGQLYLGTTNGLMRFNNSTAKFESFPEVPPNQTFTLFKDSNTLLVTNDGLFAVKNGQVKILQPSIGGDMQLAGLERSTKYPQILYGGSTGGVKVFKRKDASWQLAGTIPGIDEQTWTFSENSDGRLWVGTQNEVVYRITPSFDEKGDPILKKFNVEKFGAEQGLVSAIGNVYKIKGETWFPADSIIYKFDESKKRFVPDYTFGHFPNGGGKEEFSVKEDQTGRVLLRMGKETIIATPQPNGQYKLNKIALLPLTDRTFSFFYPENNGIIWIGTTDGLVRFDEKLEKNYDASFKTVLRHVTAGAQTLNANLADSDFETPSISFKNSTLRFEYAAPFFEQEDKTQYQTWLEGFDEGWSGWDNNYYKEYTNLPDGNYKFHVRAKNIYQKQSEEAIYEFSILPPWFRTWWAFLLYGIIASGIIYSLIRWRTRQLQEKHKQLEKTVAERTAELSQRVEELAVINSVQDGLVREMDMQGIYEMVGEKIREIFQAQVIDIVTYDNSTNLMLDHYAYEKGDRTLVGSWEPKGFRKHVIETGQLLVINKDLDKKSREFGSKVIRGEQPKSAVFVPLIKANEVKGMISLQDLDKENAFTDYDVRLLTTLANSMSVALESARRFDETNRLLRETEQRNAELAVINSVQESLVAQMNMDAIYELVGEKMRAIFNAQVIDIVTYDPKTNLLEDRYAFEKGDRTLLKPREPKGFRKHVIEKGELLIHNENVEQAIIDFDNQVLIGEIPKSQVYVPMIAAGKVTGIISLQNVDQEHAFSDSDISLLSTLANSMSVALESARLFDETTRLLKETEQRNAELAVINSVQESLVAQMNMNAIYEMVGEKMRQIFNAQVIDIVTYDPKSNLMEDRYSFEKGDRSILAPREPKGFRKHIIETGELLIHNENVEQAMIDFDNQVLIGEIPKSQVYVPMIAAGKVTGIISLQNVDQEHAFSESDVSLLSTLANSMSVALESARLFDETNRLLKETEQRNAELGVINSVQNGLVREMDMQGIYNLVGEKIREIFDAQVIDIVTYDKKSNLIEDRYSYEKGDRTLAGQREPKGFRKHIIESGQAMVLNHDIANLALKYDNPLILGEISKSAIFVPMITGGQVTGIISLQNVDHENAFSDSDVRLITTLTNTMSIALESARLFDETKRLLKETEQRSAELSVINSVQDGLAKELDMQAIYDLVGDRIIDVFNAQALIIATLDQETKTEHFKFVIEKGERFYLDSRPYDKLRQHLIETREKILINQSFEKAAAEFGMKVLPGTEHPKSLLFVPLIVGNKVKSYVSLQNVDKENAFSDSDVRLLETLANSMSVALENARLFDETTRLLKETEQRNAELAVITSVQESLVAQMDMQGIYDLVGEKMREIFNAQVIDIVTYDKRTDLIEDRYSYEKGDRTLLGARAPKGFRKHVIKTSQLLIINKDVDKLRSTYDNTVVVGQAAKSLVLVPMVAGGEVTGVISLQNLDQEDAFSESDINLLTTLVNSMSVALKSARLFDETIRLLKETEQRTAELAVINSVQQGLAKEMDMQAIYEMVGDRIRELFDAQVVLIATLDPEAGLEHFKYIIEKGKRLYHDFRPLDKLRQHLIQTRQKIVINENYEKAAARFGMKVAPGSEQPKSLLFVPLIIGGKITSYVSLQNVDKENAFSESDVRLLETLANSMSVALENARLFDETTRLLKETEQRTAELAVINNVQEGLVREMDTNAIYNLIGDRLCSLFPDTQTLVIRTFDHATGLEHWQYAIEKGIRLNSEPRPFNWANRQLILTKKYMHIKENYIETARRYGGSGVTKGQPPKSAIFVPMIVGDVVKGSVSLQNVDKENAFSDADLRLLTTLTNSMSVTLENTRLFDETTLLLAEAKQRATELSTVNNISKALASQLNPDELIELVGDQMKNLFKANIVYLALLNPKNKTIYFPYQFGDNLIPIKLGEGLTSKIILTGEPLLINKDVKELTTQLGVQRIGIPAASYLGVPIPEGDEIIGVLSVQSTEHENRFNENDLRLLSTIAASVGVALRNAKLFEEVKLSKMEAEAASKIAEKANEAKSAFLSTVSHELRTPLTSVLGFAKIIRKRLEDKIFPVVNKSDVKTEKTIHQISENLQVVISEGERLTHLINDVLDLAKIEAGKMEWNFETVSIPEVVERAISATSSLFDQKSLVLEKQIEKDLPNVSGDHDKLIQVIINLISNAVKFTDKGSVVCSVYREKKELIVSIADTGIGIAPEDFSAVFEQFKQVGGDTLTDKPKGTGLGLPICKEIVDHHGGRIWLESEIGKGSTFYFALPVLEAASIKPINLDELLRQLKDQMAESKFQSTGKDATILIVDDDDSIRSLLQQELSDGGYLIDEATNGRQALEMIRNNRPDLIILDVMMPEMNGFDVAAILKNDPQTMDIPIIVLSIVQDKIRGYRIGVDRYLTKPIDTAQLFMEVGALLEQGKSKKKVMVVDEDSTAIRSLTDVLQAKGYQVVESDGKELVENAIAAQPDIIILNSVHSGKQEIVQALRFEKGLENVLFLLYQ